MIPISNAVQTMQPSPTLAISMQASKMQSEGIDVISLSTGEPDFDTPEHIKLAAIQAINNGDTKYTAVDGTKSLKEAIINKFKKENNIIYNLDQITVGSGAKHVIFNALLATLSPQDEVIIPAPYWVSYPEMVTFAQGNPIVIECKAENGFKLSPQDLEAAITHKTKWLIINSPSNPTGAIYTAQDLQKIADVLLRYPHVNILSDDIYEHIIFEDVKFATLASVEPKLLNRIFTVNGVSKSYAMTGWRIGYAGGPTHLIKAIAKVQSQSTSNPCSISQAAAVEALNGSQDCIMQNAQLFQRRRNMILEEFNNINGLECNKPDGAFYLFPKCGNFFGKKSTDGMVLNSSMDVAKYLLEKALVAVVPGSAFGMEGFFRISYATSEKNLLTACKRMKNAFAALI